MGKPYGVIINRAGLGDRKIYEYLDHENIPVLLEIPFDKMIASDYSKGEISVKRDLQLQDQLFTMLNSIIENHGDSSDKR